MPLTVRLLVLLLLAAPAAGLMPVAARAQEPESYAGQLLVAAEGNPDPRFRKTVIYMVRHSPQSAFGIVVNKPYGKGPLANMMKGLGLDAKGASGEMKLHYGGPVAVNHMFFLHSSDYAHEKSEDIDGTFSFTKNFRILDAVAAGKGPRRLLAAVGYAGWSAGLLEREIERGFWTLARASEGLVFGDGKGDAWERVVEGSELPL